jgi:transcription elongation factor Elf1
VYLSSRIRSVMKSTTYYDWWIIRVTCLVLVTDVHLDQHSRVSDVGESTREHSHTIDISGSTRYHSRTAVNTEAQFPMENDSEFQGQPVGYSAATFGQVDSDEMEDANVGLMKPGARRNQRTQHARPSGTVAQTEDIDPSSLLQCRADPDPDCPDPDWSKPNMFRGREQIIDAAFEEQDNLQRVKVEVDDSAEMYYNQAIGHISDMGSNLLHSATDIIPQTTTTGALDTVAVATHGFDWSHRELQGSPDVARMPQQRQESWPDCSVCGLRFVDHRTLERHLNTHTQNAVKLRTCRICGKSVQASHLNTHMRFHIGDKRFKCPSCSKSFVQMSDLKTHMRVHTGEKPYKCGDCGRAFSDKSNYRKHLTIHTRP